MSKKYEALKLALEALEPFITPNWAGRGVDEANAAYAAIREALAEQPRCKYPHCPYPCPDLPDCNEVKQSVYLLIVQTPLGLRWKEPEVKNVYANKKKAKEEAARLQKSPQFRGHAWVISKKVK